MNTIRTGGVYAGVLRLLNEAQSLEELAEVLKNAKAAATDDVAPLVEAVAARKRAGGGTLKNEEELYAAIGRPGLEALRKFSEKLVAGAKLENERVHFHKLLLSNPNYFGSLEGSVLQPVLPMKANVTYEQITCVGLNTPLDRLEAVIHIKKNFGYSGDICATGSTEWVRFFVDLHDNGVWHDVGLGSVQVHDINGKKPLCYAVYRDFAPIRKICKLENIVKVRAILSWNTKPPAGAFNFNPPWGNVVDVEVQIRPRFFLDWGDIFTTIPWEKFEIKDPIGPLIKELDPKIKFPLPDPPPISVEEKKRLYVEAKVPAHRYAFAEAKQLLAAGPGTLLLAKASPLKELGLLDKDIKDLIDILIKTDGDTSYEELKCVGFKPGKDLLEAVFTVKKKAGYSGSLCKEGSTEYVAFWMDFNDGNGWTYIDTATMQVHDLQQVKKEGVQYAVYVKKNLSKYLVPCEAGARIVKVRAILSWEAPPPPNNPNYVPTWGNREECLVQLRPGFGKLAALFEVDDVAVDDIDSLTGRATGTFVEASGSFTKAPFGQTLVFAGTIGLGTDFFGGGAPQYKYRVEVKKDELGATYEPVLTSFNLKKFQRINGFLVECAPGETICDFTQAPLPAAGEGGESGWYLYHEDLLGPQTQEILSDVLMRWPTNASMEGRWKARLHVKDSLNNHYYSDEVTLRIDNTAPNAVLKLVSATFNGGALPALTCGKFPVGTVLEGTFAVNDAGTVDTVSSAFQHHRTAYLELMPAAPAMGVTPTTVPVDLSFNPPAVPTTGISGTWRLKTKGMQACGYVLRLHAWDRTIADAGYSGGYHDADEFGFCLE
jgi:hypothetical protein